MKAKVINNNGRNKAFIGAAIGAVANIAGGIIGARKKKKAIKAQEAELSKQQQFQNEANAQTQAANMSSSYANQDYVNEAKNKISLKNGGKVKTNDRIKVAKKYACGGRKKGLFGLDAEQTRKIGDYINIGSNIAATATNALTQNRSDIKSTTNLNDLTTANNLEKNKEIARKATEKKTIQPTMAMGGRRKALAGLGDALNGINSLTQSIVSPKETIKKAEKVNPGFAYEAPKTGMIKNSYSLDNEGNPINSTTKDGVAGTLNTANTQYKDRLNIAKMGMRKRKK